MALVSRRWVVQEITFARCATIYCGNTIIGWWNFCEAASLFGSIVDRVKTMFRKDPNLDQHPDGFGIRDVHSGVAGICRDTIPSWSAT